MMKKSSDFNEISMVYLKRRKQNFRTVLLKFILILTKKCSIGTYYSVMTWSEMTDKRTRDKLGGNPIWQRMSSRSQNNNYCTNQ